MSVQSIAFRTDANSQIGTGHFMRCLTLAIALKRHCAKIHFVSRHLPLHFRDVLATNDIGFVLLGSCTDTQLHTDNLVHSKWLGASQEYDAQATILALSDRKWDWLVVDHYSLDWRWESALRETAQQIMVIDDLADRRHDCDVLLDQNLYANINTRYIEKVPSHCQLLLGLNYVLLRDEFKKVRKFVKSRTGPVKRILVCFGGVDAYNYTTIAIEALAEIAVSGLNIDVVISAQHPYRNDIEIRCASLGYALHVQTTHMAELMSAADLAIGAGGAATWERNYLGLPSLVSIVAENQQECITYLAELSLLHIWKEKCELINLLNHRLSSNVPIPEIDIRFGVLEVVSKIFFETKLEKFSYKNVRRTYKWIHNAGLTDSFMLKTPPPGIKQHCEYWRTVMNDFSQIVYAIYSGENYVGNCGIKNIDVANGCVELWIYLGCDVFRGIGIGSSSMSLLEEEIRKIIPNGISYLHVLKSNITAINLYLRQGFVFSDKPIDKAWQNRVSLVYRMEKQL